MVVLAVSQIIQLCIEFNLYTPLIYISPRVDDDFITPIVKMFATYKSLKEEYERQKNVKTFESVDSSNLLEQYQSNYILQFLQDQQIAIPEEAEEVVKEIELQGYRCLWYIHMCFEGELFPNDVIPDVGKVMF